jgi:membrane-bound metal-dependent hydrolase YbcI (DUF457 family)
MPSPVGHALAGVATVWTLTPRAPRRLVLVAAALAVLPDADLVHAGSHRFFTHSLGAVIVVTIIAAAVTGWVNRGRGTAVGLLTANAGLKGPRHATRVSAALNGARHATRASADLNGARLATSATADLNGAHHAPMSPIGVALICGAACASHLLLDWLAADHFAPYGIRALWPFDNGWYISGLDIFQQTARRQVLTWPVMKQNVRAITQEVAILGPILYLLWLVRVKPAARLAPELTRAHHPAE